MGVFGYPCACRTHGVKQGRLQLQCHAGWSIQVHTNPHVSNLRERPKGQDAQPAACSQYECSLEERLGVQLHETTVCAKCHVNAAIASAGLSSTGSTNAVQQAPCRSVLKYTQSWGNQARCRAAHTSSACAHG